MNEIVPPKHKSSVLMPLLRGLKELNPWHNWKRFGRDPWRDVLSGITVAIISIPMAMAFGVASGLGAATGVWGTICGGILVGLFGGCTTGISGPTSPKVVQLALIMQLHVLANGRPDLGYAFSLVFLSGLMVLLLGIMQVGRLIYYTPYSVVSGFMCGIGVILIVLEINPMLGLPGASSLREAIVQIPSSIANAHLPALLIAGATFVTILVWERIKPIKWIPSPLVGLAVGIVLANGLSLSVDYVHVQTGLPPIYLPDASLFPSMIGPAFALAGLCAFDSLLTCLVCDNMTEDLHDSNRELFGQGLANMACGLVGGVTTATATMRSVANIKCGGRSGLACVSMGVFMLILMVGLGRFASYVPMACLGGILLKVGIDILDYRVLPVLRRLPRTDMVCFWVVLFLTLWADLLVAIVVGLAIAFFRFVQEMSEIYGPEVVSLSDSKESWSGEEGLSNAFKKRVLTLHLEGPLFFGLSDAVYRTMERLIHHDCIIVRLSRVRYIDLSGAYLLEDLVEKAHSLGTTVLISCMNPQVRTVLEKVNVLEVIGEENVFSDYEEAVTHAKTLYHNGHVQNPQAPFPAVATPN